LIHLVDSSCCWECHGRCFHDVSWGLEKEMSPNNHGQSDIVTHTTNI
jgi:hypothetical protein